MSNNINYEDVQKLLSMPEFKEFTEILRGIVEVSYNRGVNDSINLSLEEKLKSDFIYYSKVLEETDFNSPKYDVYFKLLSNLKYLINDI